MKPKKLVISAFGPYGEKTVVDFEKHGEKGLYLITGDTGAGKTTLLMPLLLLFMGKPAEMSGKRGCFAASMHRMMCLLMWS